jgi:hypothetical protein
MGTVVIKKTTSNVTVKKSETQIPSKKVSYQEITVNLTN